MSVKVTGEETVLRNLKLALKAFESKGEDALRDLGNKIMRESKNQAPLDKSTLIKSTGNEKTGKLRRTIFYNTPYAPRLHEHPEYKFQRGRKGKFLEDPLKQTTRAGLRFLQMKIKI